MSANHARTIGTMKQRTTPQTKELEFLVPGANGTDGLPLANANVSAGFPSPADDYIDSQLDLNEYLINNQPATFLVRVRGDSMTGAGINEGDILIVDRSVEPQNNKIVIGILNDEFVVKKLQISNNRYRLLPCNDNYEPIDVTDDTDFQVWGVVTYIIHKA